MQFYREQSDISLMNKIEEIFKSEIKKYNKMDIILSEREIEENKKISNIISEILTKIKDL